MSTIKRAAAATFAVALVTTLALIAGAQSGQNNGQGSDDKDGAEAGPPQGGPPPALVRVAEATSQELQRRWDVTGRLEEIRRVNVSAEQEGRLVALNAEEGRTVEGGKTVLAKVEDTWATIALRQTEARLSEARARVVEAEAQLEQAQRDRTNLEALGKAGSAKPREVDDARTQVAIREALLASAKATVRAFDAELETRKVAIDKLTIVAPFDGVITRKYAEVGQYVTPGSNIAQIVSRGQVDAVVSVPEKIINEVSIDRPVDVLIDATKAVVTGKVVAIVPDSVTSARTFPVKIRVDDEDGRFKPGMSVTARVPTGELQAMLTVPRDAVLVGRGGGTVWVVADRKAFPVPVSVDFGVEDRYVVRVKPGYTGPPLRSGSQVVIEGAERLYFPGRDVNFMDDQADSAPAAQPAAQAR